MAKIRVSRVMPVDADTTEIVLHVDHRPGTERRVVGVAEATAAALENDGKIDLFEGLGIIARGAGL